MNGSKRPCSQRRRVLLGLLLALGFYLSCYAAAQEGKNGALTVTAANTVLNQYAVLGADASAGATSFSVTNIGDLTSPGYGALAAGDLVMLYQAQGATIDVSDTASYGAVTNLGSAGRYEVVTVGSVSGNTITVDASCAPLTYSYVTAGNAQVIRIPQFTTLTISSGASVVPTAWNGQKGGVVAVHAQNAVIDGTITASGFGFRGGALDNASQAATPDVNLYRSAIDADGAEKGESVAGYQAAYTNGRYGRGAPANGGGGGNSHNAGGGGGANGNNSATWTGQGIKDPNAAYANAWALETNNAFASSGGGRGGYTFSNSNQDALTLGPGGTAWGGNLRRERGGLGGRPLDNDASGRIFLGGGGGAGDANNKAGGAGGAGGGFVLVVANSVSGSGALTSNGAAGQDTQPGESGIYNDAPGGGGGGGSVVVRAGTLNSLSIQANGGTGGTQPITRNEAEGPGGGGGGGFIATAGGTVTQTATGGNNGTTTSAALTEFPPNGATRGASGQTGTSAATAPVCTVQTGNVSGTVFADTNRNGVRETGENAFTVAATTVTLTNTSTNQTLTTATSTGAYTFSNVSPGTYSVTASASGYVVTSPATTVTVTTGAATTATAIGVAQTAPPTPCSTLYGGGFTTNNGNFFGGAIFSINTTTGARIADLFTTPYATAAFARNPINGRIYFIEYTDGTDPARLGYYDFTSGTVTAQAAMIAKSGGSGRFLRFGFNAQGVGYASISGDNSVYKIVPSGNTASVTRIGTIGAGLPPGLSGDFAITAANRAWLSGNGRIYRIDLNKPDLPAVTIYNTSNANINGVAFDTNGDILISDTTKLYRVNPGTLIQSDVGSGLNGSSISADLANCTVPALEPNLTIVKTVSPAGPVSPGTELTYTVTTTNNGNAVAVNTTFQDSIPANTTYVAGSTTKNGAAVPDDPGAVMPFVTAATITSPGTQFGPGIIGTGAANQATVSFKVRVNNPFLSAATSVTNRGFVEYDSGTGDTRVTQPTTPPGGGDSGTPVTVGNRDFGDAPDAATGTGAGNYQTTGADNGPSHTVVSGLKLGPVAPDADDGTLQNTAATADNTTGTNDEDGVSSFPAISTAAAQVITVPVTVTNTTGATASLVGYLDFNKNGNFLDAGERSAIVSVAVGQSSANIVFTTPAGLTAGTTYARFRLGGVASEVTSPVGAASSGEVEDYQVVIGSPDLTVAKTHAPATFVRGSTGTYTVTVRNIGDQPTNGTITVTDTLPAGLSVNGGAAGTVSLGNSAWTCTSNAVSPQVVTCTSTAVIATSGSSVFTLNVNVASNAGTPVINRAAVSGGGEAAANNGNNAVEDSTVTVAPTDLTLTKAHTGNFTVGQPGSYSLTVNNIGGVASSGTVTVTDTLPAGLTFVSGSATGTGWNCSASGQTVTCTSSAALPAGGSGTFSFSVGVGLGAAVGTNSITNAAAVSGGGDSNPANNSANNGNGDPTTVLSPDLSVSKTHTPSSFVRGGSGSYSVTVTNSGTAATSGTITVTDTLPAGLSFVTGSASGASWSCSASGQVVTCTSTAALAVGGSSSFSFNVNVLSTTAVSVTNHVKVVGKNEATAKAANNTYNDPTPTVDAGNLTLVKSVRNVTTNSGFSSAGSGQPGDVLEYCITYTNPGQSPVTSTVLNDTIPTTTTPLTSVGEYSSRAIRWQFTLPTPGSTQNLSAASGDDAGELGAVLTVRVGAVPAGGKGNVCFRAQIN